MSITYVRLNTKYNNENQVQLGRFSLSFFPGSSNSVTLYVEVLWNCMQFFDNGNIMSLGKVLDHLEYRSWMVFILERLT